VSGTWQLRPCSSRDAVFSSHRRKRYLCPRSGRCLFALARLFCVAGLQRSVLGVFCRSHLEAKRAQSRWLRCLVYLTAHRLIVQRCRDLFLPGCDWMCLLERISEWATACQHCFVFQLNWATRLQDQQWLVIRCNLV